MTSYAGVILVAHDEFALVIIFYFFCECSSESGSWLLVFGGKDTICLGNGFLMFLNLRLFI